MGCIQKKEGRESHISAVGNVLNRNFHNLYKIIKMKNKILIIL